MTLFTLPTGGIKEYNYDYFFKVFFIYKYIKNIFFIL